MFNAASWIESRMPLSNTELTQLSEISTVLENYERGDLSAAGARVVVRIESDYSALFRDDAIRKEAMRFFSELSRRQVPHTKLVATAFFVLTQVGKTELPGLELADVFEFATKPLESAAPLFHLCFNARIS